MKVIITKTGTVKEVSEGYAKNYLLPKGLAVIATKEAVEELTKKQEKEKKEFALQKEQWAQDAANLKKSTISITMKANADGTLFGKVSASAILEAVEKETTLRLKEEWLILPDDLKHVGTYTITVQFPSDIQSRMTIDIISE